MRTCSGAPNTGCYASSRGIRVTWEPSPASWSTPESAGPFPVVEDQRARGHEDGGQPGDGDHVQYRARGHHLGVTRGAGVERRPAQLDRVTERHEPAHDADEGR